MHETYDLSPNLAGPIMGIVVLAKIGEQGAKSDPWLGATFSSGPLRFLYWHSSFIAIGLAVTVNTIVTASIITYIIRSRKTIVKLIGRSSQLQRDQSMYSSVVATLVESAFPAAFFGIAAALIPVVGEINGTMALDMLYYTPKTLWVGFTVRKPKDSRHRSSHC